MELNEENLKMLYCEKNLGYTRISEMLGVGVRRIRTAIKKYGIEPRPFHEKGRGNRLGAVLSNETKSKISNSHKGKKLSKDHRDKVVKNLIYGLKRDANQSWKGGVCNTGGYISILNPEHHRSNSKGYVKRSIIVAEEKLGRKIYRDEVVHHINHIKDDDSPNNLLVMKFNEHSRYHCIDKHNNGIFKKG